MFGLLLGQFNFDNLTHNYEFMSKIIEDVFFILYLYFKNENLFDFFQFADLSWTDYNCIEG